MTDRLNFDEFESAGADDWMLLIKKEVKDEEAYQKLFSREINGIQVKPAYTEANAVKAFTTQKTLLAAFFNHYITPAPGIIQLAKSAEDFKADVIYIETPQIAGFSFLSKENVYCITASEKSFIKKITGKDEENYLVDLSHLYTENVQDELSFLCRKINDLKEKDTFHIKIPVNSNFFFQIAKFRAIRVLLEELFPGKKFMIHAITSYYNNTMYDVNNNLLRNATAALAAIVGGADTLSILPHDILLHDVSERSLKLAMNIHHLLRNESHLQEVPDIAKGSYYIEHLTAEIRKKTLKNYKHSEEELLERITSYKNTNAVIGVTKHPDAKEHLAIDRAYRDKLRSFYGETNTSGQEESRNS